MAELSDLLVKIANNARLTPQELDALARFGTETQLRNNFVAGNVSAQNALDIKFPFFPIYSEVLQTDTASLTIKIPGGYKNLLAFGQGRVNGSGGQTQVVIVGRFNGDSGANYTWGSLVQTNATVTGDNFSNDTSAFFFTFTADGEANAGFSGSSVAFVLHYNSSFYKVVLALRGYTLSSTVSNALRNVAWKNTASIQSLTLFPDPTYASAKIQAGSLISLYGIL